MAEHVAESISDACAMASPCGLDIHLLKVASDLNVGDTSFDITLIDLKFSSRGQIHWANLQSCAYRSLETSLTAMATAKVDIESPLEIRELEPSPIEETPKDSTEDGYFPPNQGQPKKSTTFLGLGDHGPAFYRTFQFCSAMISSILTSAQ